MNDADDSMNGEANNIVENEGRQDSFVGNENAATPETNTDTER